MGERSKRGFAAMDPEEQREIASEGGRASHGGRGRADDDGDGEEEDTDRGDRSRGGRNGNARGGSSEQHARAGRQSHRNN